MKAFIIDAKYENKRIDRVIRECFSKMPVSAIYKAFRKRDIKVNGVRVKEDYIVSAGDNVEVYIVDSILEGRPQSGEVLLNTGFSVVYEDKNILIVNKQQGIPVHPDREQSENTLIDNVIRYLSLKGEYNEKEPSAFTPSLCHRLDRNTGGLLLVAKNRESLEVITNKIKTNEIQKFYQCIVKGKMPKAQDELKSFLLKDEVKSRVFISDSPIRGSVEIITRYKVLSYDPVNDTSRLEVELVTGRTHQIRAHLAHIGHPIIGDGKYGTNAVNRAMKAKFQCLWAYKIIFNFKGSHTLSYLKGRQFEAEPQFKK